MTHSGLKPRPVEQESSAMTNNKAFASSTERIEVKNWTSYPKFHQAYQRSDKIVAENLLVHLRKICIYTHTVNVIQSSKYLIWREQEYKHVMKNNGSISAYKHIHQRYSRVWNYSGLKKKLNK